MKKKIVILLMILTLVTLNSCSLIGEKTVITDNTGKLADARMEQIMSAIKSKDKGALTSLFSKKALGKAADLDGGIDYLFDFIQGDIISWSRDGISSDESDQYGKKTLMIRFTITIHTNKDDYALYVIDYAEDTINPDNEGVYMLQILKTADENNQPSWQERMRPGIYMPKDQ